MLVKNGVLLPYDAAAVQSSLSRLEFKSAHQPCGPFPTDETTQASRYFIAVSKENILAYYIP